MGVQRGIKFRGCGSELGGRELRGVYREGGGEGWEEGADLERR